MPPPRYSRNRHPWWLRLQMLQIWISEKQYLFAHALRKRLQFLPFFRNRLSRSPSRTPRLLTNPFVLIVITIIIGFLIIFGEGLRNNQQIALMMTGFDIDKTNVENFNPR